MEHISDIIRNFLELRDILKELISINYHIKIQLLFLYFKGFSYINLGVNSADGLPPLAKLMILLAISSLIIKRIVIVSLLIYLVRKII